MFDIRIEGQYLISYLLDMDDLKLYVSFDASIKRLLNIVAEYTSEIGITGVLFFIGRNGDLKK